MVGMWRVRILRDKFGILSQCLRSMHGKRASSLLLRDYRLHAHGGCMLWGYRATRCHINVSVPPGYSYTAGVGPSPFIVPIHCHMIMTRTPHRRNWLVYAPHTLRQGHHVLTSTSYYSSHASTARWLSARPTAWLGARRRVRAQQRTRRRRPLRLRERGGGGMRWTSTSCVLATLAEEAVDRGAEEGDGSTGYGEGREGAHL